ncbi:MAG: hypothetical protein IIT97_01085, partial [Mycoplasmataceae bacterium]|nr:hypothetical protein [Mycoplasmataceae bacterium]
VVTTAIVAPIKVTKNNSNLSIISSNTNKLNITIINQDKIKTNENTNINSILLSQVSKSKIDNMINNYFGFNSSNKVNKNQSKNITNIINNSFIKKDLCKNIKFLHDSILNLKNKDQIILDKTKQSIHKLYIKQHLDTVFIQKSEFSKVHNLSKKGQYTNFRVCYGSGLVGGEASSNENFQTNSYNNQESNTNTVSSFTSFNPLILTLNIYLDPTSVSNVINLLNYIKSKVFETISTVGDAESLLGQYLQENIEDPEIAAAGVIIKIFGWILKILDCIGVAIINSILNTLYQAQEDNEGATIHLFCGWIYVGTSLGEDMW